MAARKRKSSNVINFLGFEHTGAKIIAQNKDGSQLLVRCRCLTEFIADRAKVRRSRNPGRKLQCYDCWCKLVQEAAIKSAATRTRVGGQFASKPKEVV